MTVPRGRRSRRRARVASRGPRVRALVVEDHVLEVKTLRGRRDAGITAVARGERAADGALAEATARDVGEGAHEDAHHVMEEGVALDVDAEQPRLTGVLGDLDGAYRAHGI